MSHRLLRAPALALVTVLLVAGPAFSKVLDGTDGDDTLIGTKRKDQITGREGQDLLKGKGGNDTYFFADKR
jgi:Ca2+-binding RTX toxin-like protein